MTIRYAQHVNTRATPQTSPVLNKPNMTANNAGGYSFQLDKWAHLDRFLILGSESSTYYVGERKLTQQNAANVVDCIAADGVRVVNRVVEISDSGRAPKNDPALFVLAMAAGLGSAATKEAALKALPQVARIGTHLFHFMEYVQSFRGWGRGLRRAIGDWYTAKEPKSVMHQLTKYQGRDGWTHADALRLAHVRPSTPDYDFLFRYAVKGIDEAFTKVEGVSPDLTGYLAAIKELNAMSKDDAKGAVKLITEHKMPREVIPTEHLNSADVWAALLPHMPMTAMIRNLATMTRVGLLTPMSDAEKLVVEKLSTADEIRKARVHPLAVLAALVTYASGHGVRGKNTWTPLTKINDALDAAFYMAFGNVTSTGKRMLLGLDVSGSMTFSEIAGIPGITPRVATAAMSLITAAVEPNHHMMAFSHEFIPIDISPKMRLDDVVKKMDAMSFGGTDCALPMIYAKQNKMKVDTFVIYTDSETYAGRSHPFQALQDYRNTMGIPAKLIVVGMTATEISIADPNDSGMLDIAGFDTAAPQLMSDFMTA